MKQWSGWQNTLLIYLGHLPTADLGHCPSFGMPLFVRGATASHSLFQKGGGELSSMWLCHHPDLAGHHHRQPGHHHQWQIKSSATQIPAVSNSEITLSPSLSCSYISLSTPEAIPFCFTLWYPHTHFLPCSPVTSLPLQKFGLCFRFFWFLLVKQWDELNCTDSPQRTAEYEFCQPGVNFKIPSIILGKWGWCHCHTAHAGHNWWDEKEQSASSKCLPNYCGDPGRDFFSFFL